MNLLSLFGLLSVTLTLILYSLENRNHYLILGFSFACGLGSIYGFLEGAWPFGIVEGIWAVVAFHKWIKASA